jgi:hypothetical protein
METPMEPQRDGPSLAPLPTGRPVDEPDCVYAVFSAKGRENWPALVLKSVEEVFEVANGDSPTTLGDMRTAAERLAELGACILEFLNSLMKLVTGDEEGWYLYHLGWLHSSAEEIARLADEAHSATNELSVDVVTRAREFVDVWHKTYDL